MAFSGGGLSNFYSAAIVISAAYRAGHVFKAFRHDIQMTNTQLADLEKQTLAFRNILIKGGITALGVGLFAHGFERAVTAAEELEVSMKNLQLITGANNAQMDKYLNNLTKASAETKFTTAEVTDLVAQYYKLVPGLSKQGFGALETLTEPIAKIASMFALMPGTKYKPTRTVEALGQMTSMLLPSEEQLTTQNAKEMMRLISRTLTASAIVDPKQMTSALGHLQRTSFKGSPMEQMALVGTLISRGMLPGRSAALAGTSVGEVMRVIFGSIRGESVTSIDKPVRRAAFGLGDIFGTTPYPGRTTAHTKLLKEDVLRRELGLDKFAEKFAREGGETGRISLFELFKHIQERFRLMDPSTREHILGGFTRTSQRFFSSLADPSSDFVKALEVMTQQIRDVPDFEVFTSGLLHTLKGARGAFQENFTDLLAIVGYQLTPGMARFYEHITDAVLWMNAYIRSHGEAAGAVIRFTALLTSLSAGYAGFKLAGALGGVLFGGPGATVLGRAVGTIFPWLGLVVGLALTAKLAMPMLTEAYYRMKAFVTGEDIEMLRGVPVVNEQKAALARLKAEPLGRQLVDGMKTLEELPAEFVDKYNKDLKTLFPDDYLQMMEKEKEVADALQRISGGRGGVGYGPGSKPMFPGGLPIDAQFRGDSPYWSDTNRVFALTREGLRDLTPHFANLGQAIAETTDIIRAGGQKFKSERDIKDVGNVAADALQQAAKDGFLTPWGPMSEFDPWGPGEKKRNLLNLVMGDVNYERLKAAGRIPIRAVTMPGSLIWWMKLWGKSVGAAAAHPTDPGLRAPRPEEELKARIAGIKQAYGTAADIYQHYGSALGAMYFGGKGGGEATRAVANTIGEAIIKGAVYHPPPKPSPESLQAQYGWMSAHKIREERQDFTLSLGADSQDRLAASMTSSLMGSVNRPHRNASVGSGVLMRGSTVARGPAGTGG